MNYLRKFNSYRVIVVLVYEHINSCCSPSMYIKIPMEMLKYLSHNDNFLLIVNQTEFCLLVSIIFLPIWKIQKNLFIWVHPKPVACNHNLCHILYSYYYIIYSSIYYYKYMNIFIHIHLLSHTYFIFILLQHI